MGYTANKQADKLIKILEAMRVKTINSDENIAKIYEQGIITRVLSDKRCEVKINDELFEMPYSTYLTLSKNDVVVVSIWNEDKSRRWVTDKMPKW